MANVKELKKKIKSTKGTLKITSAMKLVSAAKLSRAQQNVQNARPYAIELEETIKTVSALVQNFEHDFLKEKENKHSVLLVVSANKGLCGGYNSQLAKQVRNFIENSSEEIKVFFIGKKVRELLAGEVNVGKSFEFSKNDPSFHEVQKVANEMASMFKSGEIGKVYIAYNVFQSAISFVPTVKAVLPMSMDAEEKESLRLKYPFDFRYQPGPEVILNTLIPEAYVCTVYTCLLDAIAAEHGARMTAMDSAVTNCKDAIKTLTLKMNKLRQAAITTELIEVVSGAESLNN